MTRRFVLKKRPGGNTLGGGHLKDGEKSKIGQMGL